MRHRDLEPPGRRPNGLALDALVLEAVESRLSGIYWRRDHEAMRRNGREVASKNAPGGRDLTLENVATSCQLAAEAG